MTSSNQRNSVFGVLLFAILSFGTLFAAEVLCRIFYQVLTTQTGRWAVGLAQSRSFLRYDDVDASIQRPRFLPHPYLLYQATPNFVNHAGPQHNSMGYRQAEFSVEKKKGVTRILALGGSTTYGASVSRPEQTWPAQMQILLEKHCRKGSIEVINGGLDSAASPEILAGWIFRHRLLKPDIVILNMGINDIWPLLLTKDYSPEYLYFRRASALKPEGRPMRFLLKHSGLAKAVYANLFRYEQDANPYDQVSDENLNATDQDIARAEKRVVETENTGFIRNYDELIRVIQLDGVKVLSVMEPSMAEEKIHSKVPPKSDPSGWFNGLEHAWKLGQAKNYESMRQLSQKYQVPYLMMKTEDFRNEWFSDWYHLLDEGEQAKAKLVEASLIANRLLPGCQP